jgi:hypothetical protein
MHFDCAIYFAFGAKQVAKGNVNFNGVAVDFDEVGENPNRIIGIIRQKIVQAFGVTFGEVIGDPLTFFLSERLPAT